MQRVGQTQNKRKPHPIAQRLLASPLRFATQAVAIMQSKTMKLNPQQQAAVEYLGGALFVLAGAGSGKTRVITEKIAYMITQAGYKPHHIAAITFTTLATKRISLFWMRPIARELSANCSAARGARRCLRRSIRFRCGKTICKRPKRLFRLPMMIGQSKSRRCMPRIKPRWRIIKRLILMI